VLKGVNKDAIKRNKRGKKGQERRSEQRGMFSIFIQAIYISRWDVYISDSLYINQL
jgi:hypothetical protein